MKATIRSFTITESNPAKLIKKFVVIEKRRYMTPRVRYHVRFYDGWNRDLFKGLKVASLCEVATEIRGWVGLPDKPTVFKSPSYEDLENAILMLHTHLEDGRGVESLKRTYIDPLISRMLAVKSHKGD